MLLFNVYKSTSVTKKIDYGIRSTYRYCAGTVPVQYSEYHFRSFYNTGTVGTVPYVPGTGTSILFLILHCRTAFTGRTSFTHPYLRTYVRSVHQLRTRLFGSP